MIPSVMTRLLLVEKLFMDLRIFHNPLSARILGWFGMYRKYSPSRISGYYVDAWPIPIKSSYELGQASTGPWTRAR